MRGGLCIVIAVLFIMPALAQQLPRNETLYIAGHHWGAPTGWNPLSATPSWPCLNANDGHFLLYEALFCIDILTNSIESLVADSYNWVDDLTLEVKINRDAHWQDGKPLTADDVMYTYELGKRYDVGHTALWDILDRMYKTDNHTVRFEMKDENANRFLLLDNLWKVYLLPKHIWEGIEKNNGYDLRKIREYRNDKPVGSGPYTLYSYSSERIVLKRYDDYWGQKKYGGLPKPGYIVHPIFKSNDLGNLAFERGDVDISQQFTPRIWETWQRGLPTGTWYKEEPYYIPGIIPCILFNFERYPLNVTEVRKAIAYSIDYSRIVELAMSNYSIPAKSSFILPIGAEAQYFNESLVKQYGWEYNPQKSIEILEGMGCKKGSDGIYRLPDGTRLGPFKLECPYGWTDWNSALQIVSQSARKVGIDLQTYFPEAQIWTTDYLSGNFDIVMASPANWQGPTQPWSRFNFVMYSKGVPPVGKNAFSNYGRYRNPDADKIIEEIPKAKEQELEGLYSQLDMIFMQDVPAIPLMYRPWQFYEYNEMHWKNFPNEDNPHASPMPLVHDGIEMLYHLEPVA